ncbi:MAG: hypothetical protein IPJ39_16400 [Saprospiraceae bacterium]|nr:hypothetical protein [Saprospiraceae bacterium]
MSSLILNIVLVLLIFVPMAYFMFSKPKNSEALKINDLATQSGIKADKITKLTNAVLALDKSKMAIFYQSNLFNKMEVISLDNIKSTELSKNYMTETVHNKEISILQKADFRLKKNDNQDIILPIYDSSKQDQIGSDLLDTEDFSKQINALLKK